MTSRTDTTVQMPPAARQTRTVGTAHRPRPMPKNHPARMIGTCNSDDEYAFLDVEITGGWCAPEYPTTTHWNADLTINRDGDHEPIPVASMSLTVVDPTAGFPRDDLAAVDDDADELGAAMFVGQDRSPALAAIAAGTTEPVLLINGFVVEDEWRGTGLTAVMALRVLKVFANLGLRTAALYAAPMAEDMSPAERTRIGMKIERMWRQVGFCNLDATTGFMAMPFDRVSVLETLAQVAGRNPALRAAADLWDPAG